MAQAQGKSISELGTAATYMGPGDLALISEQQSNGLFKSKAVKKEAFEKLTIAGDRDAQSRSATSYKTISFVDNSSAHLEAGFIQQAFQADGQNATSILARKKCGTKTVDGVLAMAVNPSGSRYGYCTAEGFGVGPRSASASSANVYIQGSEGSIELCPPQTANHGGYIDFHYNGNTADYTSRLIEEDTKLRLVSTDKDCVVQTIGSGKSVILNAPANNSILQNAPTAADDAKTSKAIATVGWVASKFLPQSSFVDPSGDIQDATAMIEALAGLLNKQDLIIYVDSTSTLEASGNYVLKSIDSKNKGIFLTKDATKQTPVKSIYDAITIARKIKFLEDAQCHIRILDDQTFKMRSDPSTLVQYIEFSHPDLVQSKAFQVYGWNGGSNYNVSKHEYTGLNGAYTVRKIFIDLRDPANTLHNLRDVSLIIARSRVTFSYIVFDGMLRLFHFNNGGKFILKPDYQRSSYFIRNLGNDQIRFEKCMFMGCDIGFCGQNGYFADCAFSFVHTCILGVSGNRIEVYRGLNVNNCYRFVNAEFASFVYISVSPDSCKWKIYTAIEPINAGSAGNAVVAAWISSTNIGLVEDPNGTITIPGDSKKYARAPSAEAATKVNTNIAAFDVGRIALDDDGTVIETKKTVDGTDDQSTQDSLKAFIKDFTGRETLGYGSNGFINIGYGHVNWLKLYSATTAGWKDNEIPTVGEVSV